MVENDPFAKSDHKIPDMDCRLIGIRGHAVHIPIRAKNIAKMPSSTMTMKMDFTTDVVV